MKQTKQKCKDPSFTQNRCKCCRTIWKLWPPFCFWHAKLMYGYSKMCWGRMDLKIEIRTMRGSLSLREACANVAEIKDLCLGHVTLGNIRMFENVLRENGPKNWNPHYAGVPLTQTSRKSKIFNSDTLHSFCHMIYNTDIQYLGVRLRSTVIYRH